MNDDTPIFGGSFNRRRLLVTGGGSALLAAVLAACGGDATSGGGGTGAGVLGNPAPVPEREAVTPDEGVHLRTLASIENSIAAAYERLAEIDLADAPAVAAALTRFTEDHRAAAGELNGLADEAGAGAFDCGNPWFDERFINPALDAVFGTDSSDGSDNQRRDLHNIVYAFESWESASLHQALPNIADKATITRLAVTASRRAATMALLANPPAQNGFVSPVLTGDEAPVDADGVIVPFVITGNFGQLVAVQLVVGAPDEHGGRFSTSLATPADNAFIGPDTACDA